MWINYKGATANCQNYNCGPQVPDFALQVRKSYIYYKCKSQNQIQSKLAEGGKEIEKKIEEIEKKIGTKRKE